MSRSLPAPIEAANATLLVGGNLDAIGEPAGVVGVPLVGGCAAWFECRVLEEPEVQERYDMFVLECVAAWADDALFDGRRWCRRAAHDPPREGRRLLCDRRTARGDAVRVARPSGLAGALPGRTRRR